MQYLPLDPTEDEIRLLQIDCSGRKRHKLISQVALRKGRQRFIALSYPWGSGTKVAEVSIDDRRVRTSLNLQHAIDDVIRFWTQTHGPNGPQLLLWCDQICINQDSHEEKNHQVGFMSEIYKRADMVLIWLPLQRGIRAGFEKWPQWKAWHGQRVQGTALQDTYVSGSDASVFMSCVEVDRTLQAWKNVNAIVESPWWSRAWVYQEFMLATTAIFLIDEIAVPWLELRDLLSTAFEGLQEYTRISDSVVAQYERQVKDTEAAAADLTSKQDDVNDRIKRYHKGLGRRCHYWNYDLDRLMWHSWPVRAIYMTFFDFLFPEWLEDFGILSVPWWLVAHVLTLVSCVIALAVLALFTIMAVLGYLITLPWSTNRTGPMEAEHTALGTSAGDLLTQVALIRPNLDQVTIKLRESSTHSTESWAVARFILSSKAETVSGTPIPLSKLVKHARNCECTDTRDKIFALIGLTDPSYGIVADYRRSNTLNDVLTEATIAIITTERSLNILNEAREVDTHPRVVDHLSSWVPNFTRPDRRNAEYHRFVDGIRLPSDCRASGARPLVVEFSDDRNGNRNRVLRCRGVRICRLARMVPDSDYQKPWARFEDDKGLVVDTARTARVDDEIWILFGADVPFCLSRPSTRDPYYQVLGQATLWEDGKRSPIMDGSSVDPAKVSALNDEEIQIV